MATPEYITLNIQSYSTSPGPRYCNQGDDSGEHFYHTELNSKFYEAIGHNKKLQVILDGPDGYASSFLDEAFGNLVYDFGLEKVTANVEIISNEEPEWISMIQDGTYNEWEKRRKDRAAPNITQKHAPWYRLDNGKIEKKEWLQFAVK